MKKAFTLIELLVVIAIIAILAAILFPVFAQAKAAAKASSCLSNTKQLGLGTMQYVADADGAYPQNWYGDGNPFWEFWWQSHPTKGADAGVAYKWMDAIYPYVKSEAIYTCPSQSIGEPGKYIYRENLVQRSPVAFDQPATRRWGSYCAANGYWDGGPGSPAASDRGTGIVTESSLGDPSGTIWLADGDGSFQCAWSSIGSQPVPSTTNPVTLGLNGGNDPYEGAVVFRHANRANAVWTDGHAKSMTPGYATEKVTDNAKATFNAYRHFTVEED